MNFQSEKFAAIGAKFCTKYVKISQKFHTWPDLQAIKQNWSKWVDPALGARSWDLKGQGGKRQRHPRGKNDASYESLGQKGPEKWGPQFF